MVLSRAVGERRPLRYATINRNIQYYKEAYRSGHNGPHSKCGYRAIGTRVRIPSLPPMTQACLTSQKKRMQKRILFCLFLLATLARCFIFGRTKWRSAPLCFAYPTLRTNNALRFVLRSGRIPSLPPKGNNTNTESEKEFVLFFFNDFFGIRIKKWIHIKHIAERIVSLGFFYYFLLLIHIFVFRLCRCSTVKIGSKRDKLYFATLRGVRASRLASTENIQITLTN